MAALYLDCHVRQSRHELFVKLANSARTLMMFARSIIVPRAIAEGAQNAFEIVLVLQANVLLYECNAS